MEEVNIPTKIDCENYIIRLKDSLPTNDLINLEINLELKDTLNFTNEFLRTIKSFDVETFIKDWVKNKVRKE